VKLYNREGQWCDGCVMWWQVVWPCYGPYSYLSENLLQQCTCGAVAVHQWCNGGVPVVHQWCDSNLVMLRIKGNLVLTPSLWAWTITSNTNNNVLIKKDFFKRSWFLLLHNKGIIYYDVQMTKLMKFLISLVYARFHPQYCMCVKVVSMRPWFCLSNRRTTIMPKFTIVLLCLKIMI
jgi:hypothetical protein